MPSVSTSDVVVLALGGALAVAYLFRDQIFRSSSPSSHTVPAPSKLANGHGNPRDFIAKMKEGVSCPISLWQPINLTGIVLEKTYCHFLRFSDWYSRGICHSSCQRSKGQVWANLSCL